MRERAGIRPGDEVDLTLEGNAIVVRRKRINVREVLEQVLGDDASLGPGDATAELRTARGWDDWDDEVARVGAQNP